MKSKCLIFFIPLIILKMIFLDLPLHLTVSNGPRLSIDLPDGTYEIEASFRADRKRISRIKIEQGLQKVIHLQWQVKGEFRKDLLIPYPKPSESGWQK